MIREGPDESCRKEKFIESLGLTPRHRDQSRRSRRTNVSASTSPVKIEPVPSPRTRKLSVCANLNSPLSPLAPLRQNSRNLEFTELSSDEEDDFDDGRLRLLKIDLTSPLGYKLRSTLATSSLNTTRIIHKYESYCNCYPSDGETTGRALRSTDYGELEPLHLDLIFCC